MKAGQSLPRSACAHAAQASMARTCRRRFSIGLAGRMGCIVCRPNPSIRLVDRQRLELHWLNLPFHLMAYLWGTLGHAPTPFLAQRVLQTRINSFSWQMPLTRNNMFLLWKCSKTHARQCTLKQFSRWEHSYTQNPLKWKGSNSRGNPDWLEQVKQFLTTKALDSTRSPILKML